MTMPSDAMDENEPQDANEGSRDHDGIDTDREAHVDENNEPSPGAVNEGGLHKNS